MARHLRSDQPEFMYHGRYPPVHRCQLQFGEIRGSTVGPTRCGKGGKIMPISDGRGLPLAVHVASASPQGLPLRLQIWGRGEGSEQCLRNQLRSKRDSSDGQKPAVRTPLIWLGSALVANSLCPGQEKHTMCELVVPIANSG
jgi:hypothetical protein